MSGVVDRLSRALADRYRIGRELGAGGMATVYLAHDLKHDRQVAVKLLDPDLGAVLGVERFLAEIRVTATLQHPNLLPLFDSGVADGLLYYVMPYVEGETLRARIEREKQLPIDEAVRIATAVANALTYAHAHGVIHRDLKPENVLLQHGQPVVADFGIALALQHAGGQRVTQTGLSLGTPQYMSPEQATGDRAIDGRTDIYSLGAILYEMLSGEPPHTGATAQAIIARLMTTEPQPLALLRRSVSPSLAAAVHRALEKLPADRFESAKAFGDALSNPHFESAPHTGVASRGSRPPGGALTRSFVAIALIAVGALVAWGWHGVQDRRSAAHAIPTEFDLSLPDSLEATTSGTAAAMSVSHDGSVLVFQATRPGEEQALYVRRLGDRVVQRIRGTEGGRGPTLSPAGDEVLFTTLDNATTVIRRVAVRGGVPRSLTDSGGLGASWGDAGRIVFAGDGRLWTIPENGGRQTALAVPDSARGHIRYAWPDVLPGGQAALTAITTRSGESSLGIVTIPGGEVSELGLPGLYPRYSSTGHVLFATDDGALFAAPFSARSRTVTGPPVPIVESVRVGGGGAAAFAIANGMLVYQAAEDRNTSRELVAVSRSGTVRTLGVPPNDFAEPAISPDGRRVAVTISENTVRARALGQYPDVWLLDLASSALTRLTTDSASSQPEWIDDGQRIAFRTRDDSVVRSLPVFTTGPATPYLRTHHQVGMFAIGPRHGYAATVPNVAARPRDIWIGPTDSLGITRPFLDATYDEAWPAISPDGRWIAYVTTRTGRAEVYVRPLTGNGPEVQVSITGGREPVWDHDGATLFYRTGGTSGRIMSAQLTVGPRLDVRDRDTLFVDTYNSGYDIFPGGKELLMVRGRTGAPRRQRMITVTLHWRPAQLAAKREP